MRLCKRERCVYWGLRPHPSTGRKCYYEPGCILGWLDELLDLLRIAVEVRRCKL